MSTLTASQGRRSRTPPMPTQARRSIALIAGLLGFAALIGGGKLLLAGIAHYQAQAFIQHWEKQPNPPSEQAWQVAEEAVQRAIQAYPGSNGEYLETLGYIQQWHAFGADLNDTTAQAYRQAAVQALRESSQARPTWPDTWAALAYAKMTLLAFDDEFTHALQQAQHFGPWRIGINRRIAEIGLIAYSELNTEQRAIVTSAIQRTARYSKKEQALLIDLAQQTQHLAVLEQALATP